MVTTTRVYESSQIYAEYIVRGKLLERAKITAQGLHSMLFSANTNYSDSIATDTTSQLLCQYMKKVKEK
jgi:hypothetical protein